MGFGPPPTAKPVQQPDQQGPSEFPTIFVLAVTVNVNGFSRERVIASGTDKGLLRGYLGTWLLNVDNRVAYAGQSRVTTVPFVSPI